MIARFTSSRFIEQIPIAVPLGTEYGGRRGPHTCPGSVLWDRLRARQRRDTADIRRTRECRQIPGGDDGLIALGRCRLTGQGGRALTGKGIDVLVSADGRVGRVETVRQCLQERYDLVLLRIRQAEGAGRHVDVVRGLWLRPAGPPFHCSRRAVPRGDRNLIGYIPVRGRQRVSRVIEMYELLQALDVAVVKEFLLEIRYRLAVGVELAGLGGWALRRCQGNIARCRHLELPVGARRKL